MKKLLKSILLVFALVLTIVVAGCSFEKLELTAANNETTIAQGDSIQLVVNDETATFTVTEGLEYTYYYDFGGVNLGTEVPTEVCWYSLVVDVIGNDEYNSYHTWKVFHIDAAE
jgi:hypothetical protein